MKKRLLSLCLGAIASTALAQTVNLSLTSAQNGQTVSPGSSVSWQIAFTVSAGGNQGLALLSTDLIQNSSNPATIDIPPAAGVPGAMVNFSRPAGVSNPGENNPVTGYVGVQRGAAGERNLVQIGGGQNTFGIAAPAGTGIAESANVAAGVGQSGSVILASGSFAAPATAGTYSFSLANSAANVLLVRNNPPTPSPVIGATINFAAPSFSFTVGGSNCPGDVNGDNNVNLTDLATLLANFGGAGLPTQGDLNGDGQINLTDLAILLANFGSTC
jgi:Dockerin type I domain